MRARAATTGLLLTALALTACSGDDDAAAPTVATTPETSPATTIDVPTAPDRCEDEPDPADYADVPTAVRPCELPTELTIQTVTGGSGPSAERGDGVIFHYTAIRAEDGELIESTWRAGFPANLESLGTSPQIAGLQDGLVGARAGEVRRLDIPADLAYGDSPPAGGVIQPGDDLTYVIEVLAVVPALSADDAPTGLEIEPSIDAEELRIDDLVVGDGKLVEEGDTVVLAVKIARGDNEVVLVDSWHQGTPLVVPLDPALMVGAEPVTLPGIFEGVQGAHVGGLRVIAMPPEMAWGAEGRPLLGLPPDTDVIVIAEILAAF